MKLGIIYTGYNMEEYIEKSIAPFKALKLLGAEIVIVAVSVRFSQFPEADKDGTQKLLVKMYADETLNHVLLTPDGIEESAARNKALQLLKGENVDVIMQVDADEFFTTNELGRIFTFVKNEPFVDWFRLSLKNYVFDEKTYLAQPFTPPRIHRVKTSRGLVLSHFTDDNDICYTDGEKSIPQSSLASLTVPSAIAWIRHYSWLNGERSYKKVVYQKKRGWKCSFDWVDGKGLIWNKEVHPTGFPAVISEPGLR